ncbi:hypothetical protein L1887_44979 [Cichorium endivia]|nr:hypothetical protein L1887_44979 [Cichorium endivia]
MVFTREPGGTQLAEKLRSLVLDIKSVGDEVITDKAEVLMFYAARVQLVETVIKPALAEGKWVIGDRHDLSTQAYQGGGRGIDQTMLATLRNAVLGDFRPDLTLYLDVTPEVGLKRARARGELDRIEQESFDFFNRTRARYLELAAQDSSICTIDATHYQAGRGHHALLIQALPGMGDDALIYAITRFLMCQQPEGHKSCGKCRGCQLMQAGTHPDYYTLEPEKGKSALGIDAVREVSEKLYEHARLGGAKVVWLKDATLLTEAAANALLKTLEEPPVKTWFFLSCRDPGRLLATLRSRCRLHHLAVPQESWALSWLEREVTTSPESALSALRLSSGAPAAALALLQPDVWSERETLCRALDASLNSQDWLSLLPALNSDRAVERLHWLASLLLDALKIQQGATLLTNPDALPLVNTLANRLSGKILHAMLHDICQSREQLLTVTGLNRELLLTDQLLRIEHYLQPGVTPPVSHL